MKFNFITMQLTCRWTEFLYSYQFFIKQVFIECLLCMRLCARLAWERISICLVTVKVVCCIWGDRSLKNYSLLLRYPQEGKDVFSSLAGCLLSFRIFKPWVKRRVREVLENFLKVDGILGHKDQWLLGPA